MSAHVIRASADCLPLPDASVDLIVSSPPYHSLRSYTDGGIHYAGQIGDEDTPGQYLDRLIGCTSEWMRVLKPCGSIFVNLGDAYSNKGLRGLPWRYALRCVDDLGLILRSEIIWSKSNGLPESVTDRVRRSHEQVFHLTKLPRYYSGVDEIREEHVATTTGRDTSAWRTGPSGQNRGVSTGRAHNDGAPLRDFATSALGKLPGSVWTIPTAPLKIPASLGVDHHAAYPPELVRRIVLGWSPREVCTACGEGRRPVAVRLESAGRERSTTAAKDPSWQAIRRADWQENVQRQITGYACACPDTTAPAAPGVVLDPFGGTGTSALVASCYGRTGISVDLSHDYSRLARWRTRDGGERARVLGVDKPPEQCEGQEDLFGDVA